MEPSARTKIGARTVQDPDKEDITSSFQRLSMVQQNTGSKLELSGMRHPLRQIMGYAYRDSDPSFHMAVSKQYRGFMVNNKDVWDTGLIVVPPNYCKLPRHHLSAYVQSRIPKDKNILLTVDPSDLKHPNCIYHGFALERKIAVDVCLGLECANVGRIKELVLAYGDIQTPLDVKWDELESLSLYGVPLDHFFDRPSEHYKIAFADRFHKLVNLTLRGCSCDLSSIPKPILMPLHHLDISEIRMPLVDAQAVLDKCPLLRSLNLGAKLDVAEQPSVVELQHRVVQRIKLIANADIKAVVVRFNAPNLTSFTLVTNTITTFPFEAKSESKLVLLMSSQSDPSRSRKGRSI